MQSASSKISVGKVFCSTTMLLKQLLQLPKTSSNLLFCDPFQAQDQEELVKEVIGLANADVDGPRYILFGINAGSIGGDGIVGIAENGMADLKKAHRLVSALIEPVLHLAFIYDRINSKLVGALEIDGCDDGPFVVGQDFSEKLSRGQSWIREGWVLRALEHTELASISTSKAAEQPPKAAKPPPINVGFNDQPDCKLLEMTVPDTSNPPFASDKRNVKQPLDLKKAIKDTVATVTTRILRLGGARKHVPAAESDQRDMDTQTDECKGTKTLFGDADNHYFYEEKALKLNLTVCNEGAEDVTDVSIELGFPRLPDFDVADRLYISPFDKRSPYEVKNLGYPEVQRRDDAILVRSSFDVLAPGSPVQAFKCALRLAVGPGMQGKKIAILYTLRGQNEQSLGKGRLKIKFGEVSA